MYSRDRCRPATCRLWVADRAVDIIKVIIIIIIITRPMMRSQAALVTRRVLTVTPTSTRTPTATTIATAVRQSSLYRSLVMIMPAYLQCEFKITIRLELDAQLQLFSYSNNQPLYHLQRERFVQPLLQSGTLLVSTPVHLMFLSRVSTLTRDIDIAIVSVRLSVCPSVTFRYQIKTA